MVVMMMRRRQRRKTGEQMGEQALIGSSGMHN
jgi:hypothetical protein